MSVTILIPSPLRIHTEKRERVVVEAATVGEALRTLCETHPGIRNHLLSEDGAVRRFINVYVNDDDIRFLSEQTTRLRANDIVSIIPSIAGG
ncbi:MAG: MoaD/ThiS family protein [Bacteroidota bacterium]